MCNKEIKIFILPPLVCPLLDSADDLTLTIIIRHIRKVKGKMSLCFNRAPRHEGVLGSGGKASRILEVGTRRR